jgi:two-component system, chemotaxis family, CheB/CheR fusion protein
VPEADSERALDALLAYLHEHRGFDFTGYKRASLERRIRRRMEEVGQDSFRGYVDYLEVHPDEFPQLFNTILINVTGFFRDHEAWDAVAEEVIPRLVASKAAGEPIRVWSAGCASGEEPYTAAILLAEALGEDALLDRVKIYATDVDEVALDEARAGVFAEQRMEAVPPELRERYFAPGDRGFAVRKDLRRAVIFGRNDLVRDAPISRIDLLLCRNTLMYFNAETQARILRRFHFALNPGGYLFLGKSEMLLSNADVFQPADRKRRLFTKVLTPTLRDRLVFAGTEGPDGVAGDSIRGGAFDAAPVAQVVVDRDGLLVEANDAARRLLQLEPEQLGRPLREYDVSLRPAELRGHIDEVIASRRSTTLPPFDYGAGGETRVIEVVITPVLLDGEPVGASLAYNDTTQQRRSETEVDRLRLDLSTAYEELQTAVEELETTNEELQSTNEELETTNEELQSTNEELETMNEELQSSNEELNAMNEELRQRSLELNEVNAFMETILGSMGAGVIVVDRDQTVRVYNQHSQELWGLRPDEAEGRHVLNLDIGLPVEELRQPIRDVLGGASERARLELAATDRRGRPLVSQVTVLPLMPHGDGVTGAIIVTERMPSAEDG